ncbi:MAG: hypothetical protein HYY00_06170 [Chloroflexi bacterium]|nr:hypothetical protein [Chloroflexota bacterium]
MQPRPGHAEAASCQVARPVTGFVSVTPGCSTGNDRSQKVTIFAVAHRREAYRRR